MDDVLLPCPFCGSVDAKEDIYAYRDMCIITCNAGGCNGPLRGNGDDARVAWNSRYTKTDTRQIRKPVL